MHQFIPWPRPGARWRSANLARDVILLVLEGQQRGQSTDAILDDLSALLAREENRLWDEFAREDEGACRRP
jgi:hypothetical protein